MTESRTTFYGPAKSGPFLFNSQISPVNYFNSSRITWADLSRRRATRRGRRSGTVLSGAGHSRVRFPTGGRRGREIAWFGRVFLATLFACCDHQKSEAPRLTRSFDGTERCPSNSILISHPEPSSNRRRQGKADSSLRSE